MATFASWKQLPDRWQCHRPGGVRALASRRVSAIFPSMAKAIREKIKLVSSAGTGYFYTATKNRRLQPEKLTTTKYDPKARKHVEFTEQKMK